MGMDETRESLLLRAQNGQTNAWEDLTDLYRPLILGWLNRQGVPAIDLEDLSQDVLLSVVTHLPTFEHSGQRGAFRTWLRTIVCRRTADYWRAVGTKAQATGGSGAIAQVPPPYAYVGAYDHATSYTTQYLFNIQRQLGQNYVVELGYLGSESHHL